MTTIRQRMCGAFGRGHKSNPMYTILEPGELENGRPLHVAFKCELCGYSTRWFEVWPLGFEVAERVNETAPPPNVEVTGASGAFAAKRPCGPQG